MNLGNIFDLFENQLNFIFEWLFLVVKAEAWPNFAQLLCGTALLIIWGGSGFLSATIAEIRGHKIRLHFIAGLLLPYFYPLALSIFLPRFHNLYETGSEVEAAAEPGPVVSDTPKPVNELTLKLQQKQQERLFKMQGEATDSSVEPAAAAVLPPPAMKTSAGSSKTAEDGDTMDKNYMESIAVDNTGMRAGPFELKLKDGSVLQADCIVEAQEDVVVLEMTINGKTKTIRFKYTNIESCVKKA